MIEVCSDFEGLFGEHAELMRVICQKIDALSNVSKIVLFGSYAKRCAESESDIDLAVCGGDIVRFSLDLDDRIPTLLMFDVVDLDGPVDPDLLGSIQREGIVLYEEGREFSAGVEESEGN